jgi:aldehyde:ferredoxin oxidoreductase
MGARHSHLDNAGYSVDQKALVKEELSPEMLGDALLEEESWRQILSSIVICYFAREIYDLDTVLNCLKVAGFDLDEDRLLKTGRDIHREKFRFKTREGFSFDALRIPERILQTKAPAPGLSKQYIRAALDHVRNALV